MPALTLAADLGAADTAATLSGPLTATYNDLFRLESEIVAFRGYSIVHTGTTDLTRVRLQRARERTTAAAHATGVALLGVSDAFTSAADASTAPGGFPVPPEVPATPDAQDVTDALVTLGLVTQAAP